MRWVALGLTLTCGCYASHERAGTIEPRDSGTMRDSGTIRDASSPRDSGLDAPDVSPQCFPPTLFATLEAGHCNAFFTLGGDACSDDFTGHARYDVPAGHDVTFEIVPSVVGPGATTGGFVLYDPTTCTCDGVGQSLSVPTTDVLHFTSDRRAVEIQLVGVGVGFGVRACISR